MWCLYEASTNPAEDQPPITKEKGRIDARDNYESL